MIAYPHVGHTWNGTGHAQQSTGQLRISSQLRRNKAKASGNLMGKQQHRDKRRTEQTVYAAQPFPSRDNGVAFR